MTTSKQAVSSETEARAAQSATEEHKPALTESQLRRMPKKSYMNEAQLLFFRDLLISLRQEIEENIKLAKEELAVEWRESDDNDIASLEEERAIKLRIIERESKVIPKILYSLRQIAENNYGYCEETGEPIGVERLLLRPTATLSIAAKSFHEQKEKEYSDS